MNICDIEEAQLYMIRKLVGSSIGKFLTNKQNCRSTPRWG